MPHPDMLFQGMHFQGMHRPGMPFGATFMAGDFCAASIIERLPASMATTRFQLASCQFAMHYAFDSEARASALLANAAGRLELEHGIFVATIPDANVLVRRLRASSSLEFGNGLYRVVALVRASDQLRPQPQREDRLRRAR